jgi:hypothetical protein
MNEIDDISDKDLVEANKELILFKNWWLYDFMTVIFHFIIIFLLGFPMIYFSIFERQNYYPYALEDSY